MAPQPRVVNIIGIRVDLHWQYLLVASRKYRRVKLSVICVFLWLQLRAITTSSMLQTRYLKTTRLPSRLVVEARCHKFILTTLRGANAMPSFYPGCTHTCIRQLSPCSSLPLFSGCFLSRKPIRVCLPPLMSCRSYVSLLRSTTCLLSLTDNHVIDAWVHMPPERF